jgi:two-component system, cell cycle response regulator DivK
MKPLVLLVEDNLANRYLATFLLEQAGAEVVSVGHGAAALAAVRARRPHVIVMDLSMPVMDGYTAAAALRADPATATIPLVAATAYAQPAERERAFAAGFVDYFEKPLDIGHFAAAVLRHVVPTP